MGVEFDAYIIPTNELTRDIFRLLDVDTRIVVPFNIHVRILISSADVLHAWTVPSLGVKADAVPGRFKSGEVYCSAGRSVFWPVFRNLRGESYIYTNCFRNC